MIPALDASGKLPPGVHDVDTWDELAASFGNNGHRQKLLTGLADALRSLKAAGCGRVYLDGSFVTGKDSPNDFDACWEPLNVDHQKLDPVLLRFENKRAAQKAKFGGELFPASERANGAGQTYLQFFQQDPGTGQPKGILAIDLQRMTL